jgi:hypothetical protein
MGFRLRYVYVKVGMNEIHKRYVASVMAPTMSADPVSGHRYQGWAPCIRWCEEHLDNYRGWWYVSEGVFEFEDEADHLMFVLRWA